MLYIVCGMQYNIKCIGLLLIWGVRTSAIASVSVKVARKFCAFFAIWTKNTLLNQTGSGGL